MTTSRSSPSATPLPPRATEEIQRARTIIVEVRQALTQELARLTDLEQAMALLVEGPPPGLAVPLTPRERDILRLVAQDYTNPQIAQRLRLKQRTPGHYMQHIYAKLQTRNRVDAVLKAWQLGLI